MAAKILVVDDDRLICELIAECLRDAGHHARCVLDALAALDAVERDPPDLVVTDLMMPRLDGAGLVARLRERGDAIPVVAVSAVPHRAAGLPVAAVVAKPFDLDHLCTVVARVLRDAA